MWRWVGGLPKLTTCKQAPTHLKIIQTETRKKKTVTIKRIETTDFERVLGVRMDIAGTWKGEIAEWIGKSLKFASKVRTAKFPRQCGIRVYQFIWVPKIRYVSSIVCFTKEQCQKIQSPVIKACLSASGLSAQFPRAVVFGPQTLGGLGWEKGRSIQTFEFINLFLNHVKQNDSTGKLMLINLETAQLHSGLSTPILQQQKTQKAYFESSWIYCLHALLTENKLQIEVQNNWMPVTQRTRDEFLMDKWTNSNRKKTELILLNSCRFYLQVSTVSDIATFDGTEIEKEYFEVIRAKRKSQLEWPIQPKPSKIAIRMWKEALREFTDVDRKLKTTLGRWTNKGHQRWTFFETKMIEKQMQNYETRTNPPEKNTQTDFVNEEKENVKNVLGTCKSGQGFSDLELGWNEGLRLTAATDGGLKKSIGTHSYSLYHSKTLKNITPEDYNNITMMEVGERGSRTRIRS